MSAQQFNNDELDQKNNNDRPDLNEIKLTIKDDEQFYLNDNQTNLADTTQRTINLTNSTENPLFDSTSDNPNSSENLNNTNSSNFDDDLSSTQNLPPPYQDVPGIVPISAGTNNGPPPSYEDVIDPNCSPPTYQSLFGQVQQARKNAKTLPDLIRKLIIILLGTIGLAILISFTILIPFTMIIVGGSNLDNCKAEKIPLFLLIGGITWLTKNISNFFSQCSSRRNRPRTNTTNSSTTNNTSTNTNDSSNPCASRFSTNTCQAESNTSCSTSLTTNRSSRCVINLENETTIPDSQASKTRRRDFLINCFITAWFLTGCIMVYRVYPPNYTDPTSPNYCNKTVYVYAFWLLTSTFIIFALFISCICCVSLTAIFSSNSEIRI